MKQREIKEFMGFENIEELRSHIPHGRSMGELYMQVLEELSMPYPAAKLPAFPKLNELIGGFRAREFTILCGSTGAGKTTLIANLAQQFIQAGKRCFVMSVETGATDFIKRVMGVYLKKDINGGDPIDPDILKVIHAQYGHLFSQEDEHLFLSLYDNRVSHEVVIQDIEWYHKEKNCDIVFIDNLNFLLEVCSANRQVEEMDKVVHDLIMLAKRTDIHIVMIMHPKKTQSGTRVESEFDIKGSSTAVQEAHNVFLFNRPKTEDIKQGKRGPFLRELVIRKLRRRGSSIGKSLWMEFNGAGYKELNIEMSDI